jgi:hemoglobin
MTMWTILLTAAMQVAGGPVQAVEEPVAPYVQSPANAGAKPFKGDGMWQAFHEAEGVERIVDEMLRRSEADPRIADIFQGQDPIRLRRTLREQFCYLLGGGCTYTGRSMKDAHRDMGLQQADMAALVEHLQAAMRKEAVPFGAQNRFLAKLAPMKRQIVER